MATKADDLDLLLSLQDRVLETPPASPSAPHSGMSQSVLYVCVYNFTKYAIFNF